MDIQTQIKIWASEQLKTKGHGAKSELARYMGVHTSAISKMLSIEGGKEKRNISADELVKLTSFFKAMPPHLLPENCDDYFLSLYSSAKPEHRKAVISFLKSLQETSEK
ncbi:XRE family transcriptional regulator [Bartonella sp. DGB2]|uniref:XRE family transcriptional regulator n=1 Tax=Bartonella sp. DGB2 TaxID=3388426 RepID=UPI0039902446